MDGHGHKRGHEMGMSGNSSGSRLTLALRVTQHSMVNNAGTGGTESAGAVHDMSEDTWDFVMYVALHVSSTLGFSPLLQPGSAS